MLDKVTTVGEDNDATGECNKNTGTGGEERGGGRRGVNAIIHTIMHAMYSTV